MESSNFLMTMKQSATPLNKTFFSIENLNVIQRTIRQRFRNESSLSIDNQNENDLLAIMRQVFIDYGNVQPYGEVCSQVKSLNEKVVDEALSQVRTNVSQFMSYVRDMDKPIMPPATPENTSIYGLRIPDSRQQIG